MTVTYSLEVSQARFWGFPKLLARWRGSIYRLMYREMLFYLATFYMINVMYRLLPVDGQRGFEVIAIYCREFAGLVPITFVLGFYVTFVVGRWWQQYTHIPWPDRVCMEIAAYVHGTSERSRLIRRSLARYLNLMAVITFQSTSTVIKKRFPTLNHMVEAGLMTNEEKADIENTETPHGLWWIPSHWFTQLCAIARKESLIHDDLHLKSLIDDCLNFRNECGWIWSYDWISVPLVYTQVVTIAVYSFFMASLFGRQYLEHGSQAERGNVVDLVFPVFSVFQFFFYVGWLKVAESMICPFGEDDDDFDMNWVIDRNLQVSLLIVDGLYRHHPTLTRDSFWDNTAAELPYTNAAAKHKTDPWFGSASAMDMREEEATEWECEMPPITEEARSDSNIDMDNESISSPTVRKSNKLAAFLLGYSRSNISAGSRKSLNSINPFASFRGRSSRRRPGTNPQSLSETGNAPLTNSEPDVLHARSYTFVSENNVLSDVVKEESEGSEQDSARVAARRNTAGVVPSVR